MIKAIVFDIGGVLAQDVWEHLYLDPAQGIIARYPELDAAALEATGNRLWERYAYTPAPKELDWRILEREYWIAFIQEMQAVLPTSLSPDEFIDLTDDFVQPIEGMPDLMSRLAGQGLALAICSNNNEFWYARQAERLNLEALIPHENVILSSRVGASKSSPNFEMFKAVSESLRCKDPECLFIDDRPGNVDRAKQFGMQSVLFDGTSLLVKTLHNLGIR